VDRRKGTGSAFVILGTIIVVVAASLWWSNRGGGNDELVEDISSGSSFNCGLECVCYLAAYWGLKITPSEIRRIGGRYLDDGTISLNDLKELSESITLGKAYAIEAEVDDLDCLTTPFIAHETGDDGAHHYVVCSKVSDNYVQIIDILADGSVIDTVPKEIFDRRFTGYALVIARR